MNPLKHRRGSTVALVAAVVLMLQAVISAWGTGAMASVQELDGFGNPLCITSTDHDGQAPTTDHSSLPNCCTFGCNFAANLLATPTHDGGAVVFPMLRSDRPRSVFTTARPPGATHNPANPRAPPPTI